MIIIGYPGIGKSTLGGTDKYVDLDSTYFKFEVLDKDWKREYNFNDWVIPYIDTAVSLSKQGYKVFVSSHERVVQILSSIFNEDVLVITPAIDLKDEWVQKLHERYLITQLTKDYRAWSRAAEHYEEDINSLSNTPFEIIEIESMDYDLADMLYYIKKKQEL